MNTDDLIYVAGHTGLVGSALVRELKRLGYSNLVLRTHKELELTDAKAVSDFFAQYRPAYVFLAAAKVGGIGANTAYPAEFLYQNLAISINIIDAARTHDVSRLLNFGSSCIYPRLSPQPIPETALLTGVLEPTNRAYALAKIAALQLCVLAHRDYGSDFYSVMPTNLYGKGDNYDPDTSHVLPALIGHFHAAKTSSANTVTLWGDGSSLREFLSVDDLAKAAVFLMRHYNAKDIGSHINIGAGPAAELSIAELAELVRDIVYTDNTTHAPFPEIEWDTTKPNGTPRKLLDSSRINALGWMPSTALKDGITATYADYLIHHA